MRVNIKRLKDAMGRTLWRNGHVKPESFRHVVNADGSHTFALTIAREDAVWDEPPKGNPMAAYPSVGWKLRVD